MVPSAGALAWPISLPVPVVAYLERHVVASYSVTLSPSAPLRFPVFWQDLQPQTPI